MFPVIDHAAINKQIEGELEVTRKLCDALFDYLTHKVQSYIPSWTPPSLEEQLVQACKLKDSIEVSLNPLENALENIKENDPQRIYIEQLAIPQRQQLEYVKESISKIQKELEQKQDEK